MLALWDMSPILHIMLEAVALTHEFVSWDAHWSALIFDVANLEDNRAIVGSEQC